MKHVNLDTQEESVKRFVMALAIDAQGSVLELGGRPFVRVLPVAPERNGHVSNGDDWTDAKNDRRCELIDKEIDASLSSAEQKELEDLQEQMLRYRHRVAPLPTAHARRLLDELERKAANATGSSS